MCATQLSDGCEKHSLFFETLVLPNGFLNLGAQITAIRIPSAGLVISDLEKFSGTFFDEKPTLGLIRALGVLNLVD